MDLIHSIKYSIIMFYTLVNLHNSYKYPFKKKVFIFLKGFMLHLLFVFISILLIMAMDEFIVKVLNFPSVQALFKKSSSKIVNNYSFFLVVIFLPFIEELFFRLFLVPSRKNIAIFSFLLSMFIYYGGLYPAKIDMMFIKAISISSIVSIISYYFLQRKSQIIVFYTRNRSI